MKIVPASADHAEALAGVHAASFDSPWRAEDIVALIFSPGGFALAAEEDAGVRGFVLVRANAGEAEILTLAVAPGFRRQGFAELLTDAAAAVAGQAGAEALFLEVAEDNSGAIALYAKTGFTQVGRRRGYYAREDATAVDALVMRRDLNRRPS